jgi:antitoxin Phd
MSNARSTKKTHGSIRSATPKVRRPDTLNINRRGQSFSAVSMSATSAKNEFGRALETALRDGYVVITKHDQPKAVLVSLDEFEALSRSRNPKLDALSAEFDQLLADLQTPHARSVIQSVFESSPEELGRAAVEAARHRK